MAQAAHASLRARAPSLAMAEQRAASAPAKGRALLDHATAYKATVRSGPKYSLRVKTSFGDALATSTHTEPTGDVSGKLDSVLKKSPSWSLTTRGTGIPKPPHQPGPGEYRVPSTLYGAHPALACPGRVPKTSDTRPDPGTKARKDDYPAPNQYQTSCSDGPNHKFGRADQQTVPKYSMRSKLPDPADKEVRPGCTKYDLGKASRKGIMTMPSWSMAPRGNGIPKSADYPGPGYYSQPGSIYGSHPALAQPGRVAKLTSKRFTYPEPDERPY
uniref:Uncharacterized protein n=1 Tax=Alexandrium monilatum TaxID=311494 RepID=A0A7S4SKL3_9DINO